MDDGSFEDGRIGWAMARTTRPAPQLTTASERTDFDSFESAHTQHHAESCLTTPNLGESEPRPYPNRSKLPRRNFARPLADDCARCRPSHSHSPPQPQIWIRPSWHACRRRCALVCYLPPLRDEELLEKLRTEAWRAMEG